jgi:hypothetical protein
MSTSWRVTKYSIIGIWTWFTISISKSARIIIIVISVDLIGSVIGWLDTVSNKLPKDQLDLFLMGKDMSGSAIVENIFYSNMIELFHTLDRTQFYMSLLMLGIFFTQIMPQILWIPKLRFFEIWIRIGA